MLHFFHFRSFLFTLTVICGGLFLFESCESTSDDSTEESIAEERDARFVLCYHDDDLAKNKADSIIHSFFGEKASAFVKLNNELSFIGCDEGDDLEMLSFGDENCCFPRTYDLIYDIILNSDTISQITIIGGSEMNFDFISEDDKTQLKGYKYLLDGELKIDYNGLLKFMKTENMNPDDYSFELTCDTLFPKDELNAYFWEIYTHDGLLATSLHAMSGEFKHIRPAQ